MKEYYRPTIAKIYIENLIHNYMQFKKLLGQDIEIAPVIKADAYGHGAVKCASELLKCGVKTFCVAFIDEAVELRNAGIKSQIIILGATKEEHAAQIIDYDLMPAVFEIENARSLSAVAKKKNKICKIHIKVDTGMGRIGLDYKKAAKEIKSMSNLDNLSIQGIFSHYASADESDKSYTNLQKQRFFKVIKELKESGIEIPVKHTANSAASLQLSQDDMNMIRLGISLYGYCPFKKDILCKMDLRPVMQLQTEISYIKSIKTGESISYNRQFTAEHDMIVGTLPIGYADGYRREFKNKAYAIIAGCKAPIIGTVCMDQTMVDLTDIKNVNKGDLAVMFGPGFINTSDLAEIASTISYEILCGISKRVPRIYV